jgi:preprotein translocase subunit SecG
MQEVVLVIHLILAVTIIGLVLLQRSSGGGLGTSGGGMGDFATARGAASALSKLTMFCAFGFFLTSLGLAVIARHNADNGGLLDQYTTESAATPTPAKAANPTLPAAPNAEEGTSAPVDTLPADKAAQPETPATPEPPVSTQ